MDRIASIGMRLREERKRIRLSQTEVADIAAGAGVTGGTRQSQSLYEKGERSPDAAYLAVIAAMGMDVRYILTGRRDGPPPEVLGSDERELLSLFRRASLTGKAAAIGALQGVAGLNGQIGQQINAPVRGGVAGRDLVHKGRKKKNETGDQQ